jgi:hypothetical protein
MFCSFYQHFKLYCHNHNLKKLPTRFYYINKKTCHKLIIKKKQMNCVQIPN